MEHTAYRLNHENCTDESKIGEIHVALKKHAHDLINTRLLESKETIKRKKVISDLKRKENLVLSRPDKGNGTVIMTKSQYLERVNAILCDNAKFKKLDIEIDWNDHPGQKRVTDILQKLVKEKQLPQDIMDKVPKGCVIPRLPKVHKSNYPLRPVLSMTNSAYHSVAKFLDIEILKPLVVETKLFSIKDSFEFKDAITNIQLHDEEVCLSFDVRNLFTCIPVDQTIDLICDKLYRSDRSPPKLSECVLTESNCRSLLKILTKEIHFVFDGIVYQQSDGLAMGSPLSGSFSELFMNSLEEQMTSTLQSLSYYGRFADDTFLVARNEDMGNYLFRMFNNLHPSIKFTRENADHFLDIQLHRDETGNITSSVFRKETFTSLYKKFNSFSPRRFKSNPRINIILQSLAPEFSSTSS